jgi:hypothetical protein
MPGKQLEPTPTDWQLDAATLNINPPTISQVAPVPVAPVSISSRFGTLWSQFGSHVTSVEPQIISGPLPIAMLRGNTPGKAWWITLGDSSFKLSIEDATSQTLEESLQLLAKLPAAYRTALGIVSEPGKDGIAFYESLDGAAGHGSQAYLNILQHMPIGVILHECGHALEQRTSRSEPSTLTNWAQAILDDGIPVSDYGDGNAWEDLAEFSVYYALCLDAGSESLLSLQTISPKRFALWQHILETARPDDAIPTVVSISPSNGPISGGTEVTITGTNLTYTSSVVIGRTTVALEDWRVVDPTTVICRTPLATSVGQVTVKLTTDFFPNSKRISTIYFNYAAAPTITSLAPTSGPVSGGRTVTITGTNLTDTSGVTFGGTAVTSVRVESATRVTCVTPAHAAGAVNVVLTAPGGAVTSTSGYTYTSVVAAPTITSLARNQGPDAGGRMVTITGTNLTGTSGVTFGGTAATLVTVVSPTTVTCVTPAHAAGVVDVVVTVPGDSVTMSDGYHFMSPPSITSMTPNSGPVAGDTTVTITGIGLDPSSIVTFGGTDVTPFFFNRNFTELRCVTPSHAAGLVDVEVTSLFRGAVTSTGGYTYTSVVAAPTITSLAPTSGSVAGGKTVTITGTNLTGTSSVTFGGTAATLVTVVSPTSVTCVTPEHAADAVNVVLTAPGGAVTSTVVYNYTVLAASVNPGDLNADRTVNIFDLILVRTAYASLPTDVRWDARADTNGDRVINISDLIEVRRHFAKTYP